MEFDDEDNSQIAIVNVTHPKFTWSGHFLEVKDGATLDFEDEETFSVPIEFYDGNFRVSASPSPPIPLITREHAYNLCCA